MLFCLDRFIPLPTGKWKQKWGSPEYDGAETTAGTKYQIQRKLQLPKLQKAGL